MNGSTRASRTPGWQIMVTEESPCHYVVRNRNQRGVEIRLSGDEHDLDRMIEEVERYAEQHSPGIRYRALFVDLRDLLALHEVKIWPERLSVWLRELDDDNEPSKSHVRRTRDALSGPGRLDDIFICKANGHRIASSDEERDVNRRYSDLLRELNDQTSRLLCDFPR